MKPHHLATALAVALALSGCASDQTARTTNIMVTPPAHPLDELRIIAVEARDELRLLAKVVDAKNAPTLTKEQHAQKHFQAIHVPAGFERIAKFTYTGPATKAAAALAKVAGYKFAINGKPLSNEPWVSLHIDGMPLAEALRELGVQTGTALRVEVHEASRLMILVHK